MRAAAVSDPAMLGTDAGPVWVQANYHRSLRFMRNELIVKCHPPLGTTVSSQVAPPFCHLLHPALGDRRRGRVTSPHYISRSSKEESPSFPSVMCSSRFPISINSRISTAAGHDYSRAVVLETPYTVETFVLAFFSAATSAIFFSRPLTWLFISASSVVFISTMASPSSDLSSPAREFLR